MKEVYEEEQIGRQLSWCVTVIRNAAKRAKRRHARWAKECLTVNQVNETGTEHMENLHCPVGVSDLDRLELDLLLESLPLVQAVILRRILLFAESQQEIANHLGVSQQQVSRHKNRGLLTLRERTPGWNTPSY